mmetsp:Transcript_75163/g.212600  ORF Transcript_75163/g.212600 Transcript_75163/m.212600 type:complete len:240 (-) Transcript_75163:139-858(-)|eukprot:CAMPEP_0168425604 /NCGR_PEP_ID=MMETSP0228-20121227/35408_1 /TAXON_ID=133427 /ORGANISM="Protoceratium reticulatum, Strain CCCM 535 (=CCMP 1889)" /LENGTH=239 /DNA_ID=CAMNT_0008439599 /DNA_START=63 /DNA_END=782 /DNA_ORIENTATION=-
MVTKPTLVTTAVSTLAFVILLVLPVSFKSIVGDVPSSILLALPATKWCFDALVVCTALIPVFALVGGVKRSDALIGVALVLTIAGTVLAVEVLFYAVLMIKFALPYIWKVFPGQCHEIPHVEKFGYVVSQGCPHQCLASLHAFTDVGLEAAMSLAMGSTPTVSLPSADYKCIDSETWNGLESMVANSSSLLLLTVGSLAGSILFLLTSLVCGVVELYCTATSAREKDSKVKPLLGTTPA